MNAAYSYPFEVFLSCSLGKMLIFHSQGCWYIDKGSTLHWQPYWPERWWTMTGLNIQFFTPNFRLSSTKSPKRKSTLAHWGSPRRSLTSAVRRINTLFQPCRYADLVQQSSTWMFVVGVSSLQLSCLSPQVKELKGGKATWNYICTSWGLADIIERIAQCWPGISI